MPVHNFARPQGKVIEIDISSPALVNQLGDPTTRTVAVYVPPQADSQRLPLFVDLVGITGSGFSHLNWRYQMESVPVKLDRLVAEGRMGPVICAFPDCYTSIGGNQYIDNEVTGNWEQFLCHDMIEALEAQFPIEPGRDHRALFGKSSGGYGAIVHAMRHADTWAAVACHSGDMDFNLVFRRYLASTCDTIAAHGGIEELCRAFDKAPKPVLMEAFITLAMCVSFDPDPTAFRGIRMPMDLHTGALDEEAWRRWLAWDPINMVDLADSQDNLRSLAGLFIDCGSKDQYLLHYGARQFTKKLSDMGIKHHYEEFEDDHSNVDYRMDVSLPWLYRALGRRVIG